MRVVSFNIRSSRGMKPFRPWRLRRHSVHRTLLRLNPDVLLMQEVRLSQLRHLRRTLSDYTLHAVGRDDGARRGEMLAIAVRRNGMNDVAVARWFSDTPERPSRLVGARARRMSLSVVYRGITFVNVHLDEAPNPNLSRCASMLVQWFGGDAVIGGDFNCRIDDPALAPLWAAGLRDALGQVAPSGNVSATHHGFKGSRVGSRIDHVLVPTTIHVSRSFIDQTPGHPLASDHWPVVVDLAVSEAGR